MTQLTDEESEKLQRYAVVSVLPKLQKSLRKFGGFDKAREVDDLISEIWYSYGLLLKSFDLKRGVPKIKYIGKFAYKCTLKRFITEIKRQEKQIQLDGVMNMKDINVDDRNTRIEIQDRVADVLRNMSLPDLEIAKMYLHGLTLEQIGGVLSMSKGAVLKRLQKYRR